MPPRITVRARRRPVRERKQPAKVLKLTGQPQSPLARLPSPNGRRPKQPELTQNPNVPPQSGPV
nr:MAG TPA: hypothetical protein [Bacteriophage sp.]